jgi:SAM-dependent methyltransferase
MSEQPVTPIDYSNVVQTHATRWQDADAARSYKSRPPYAPETFSFLSGLIADAPRHVLDVGCGTGKIARGLAPLVARIDAVDIAAEMIAEGRTLAGGEAANIHWRVGRGEDAPLDPPYALIVGGESLHWMHWETILPRFAAALTAAGVLANVRVADDAAAPRREGLVAIIKRYSTQSAWRPFDMLTAWRDAGLYQPLGVHRTAPFLFEQGVEGFIDAHHAMSALTRAHIDADAFDAEMRALFAPHCPDGVLRREICTEIAWGKPLSRHN